MTRQEILIEIDGEIARLFAVRRMLAQSARGLKKIDKAANAVVARASIKRQAPAARKKNSGKKSAGKKRILSPEGRRNIALGQKKRWAQKGVAQKKK